MTFLQMIVVGLGGFLGAVCRYMLSNSFNHDGRLPLGTLLVNGAGSFLIGLVFGLNLSELWTFFLASGFAGALTTFSTLQKELIERWKNGQKKQALIYTFITLSCGLLLATFGYLIAASSS